MQSADRHLVTYDLGREDFVVGMKNEVAGELQGLASEVQGVMREIDGMRAEAEADLDISPFLRRRREIDAELKEISRLKAEAKADLDTKLFDARAAQLVAEKEELERKIEIPVDLDRGTLSRGAAALRSLNSDLDETDHTLSNWLRSLGKVRLQMGPVSGTVRQMALAFGLLGPVIFSLVGSASALIGVVGTGLTGALTVGGAAVSGFGLALVGLLPSLKQLFTEAKAAPSIVGPLRQMRDTLTGDIRQNFFQGAHQAIRTLQSDFPTFRQGATAAFGAATQGWEQWMRGLRSPEAKQILSTILSNFTQALPGVMQGLGTLGATLGRVFGSASKLLPSLTRGFSDWAAKMSQSVGSGTRLDAGISRLVGHMRDLGHFAQASGRLLVTFFNAGANSGDSMTRSLTATFNQWTAWMHSVEGQKSLQNFFARSEAIMRQLLPTIARIGTTLANVSAAFEPLTQGAATMLNAIAKAAAAVPPPVLAAAGAFLILNRAITFLAGEKGFARILSLFSGLAPMLGSLRAAFGVEGLGGALRLAGTAAAGLLSPLAGAAAVFGGVVIGARLLSGAMDGMDATTRRQIESWRHENTLVGQLPSTYSAYRSAIHQTKQAQEAYDQTLKKTGADSHAADQAARALNQAIRQQNAELASLRARGLASYNQGVGDAARSTQNWQNYLNSTDPYLMQLAQSLAASRGQSFQFGQALQRNGTTVIGVARSLKELGLSVKTLGLDNLPVLQNALQQFNQTQQSSAARVVNYIRSLKGLAPVTGQAAGAIGKFIQQFGKVPGAKRAVIQTNAPQQAGQIARLSTKLNQLGARPAVIRILTSDKDAGGKIDALKRKAEGVNKVKGTAKLDAQDSGLSGKVAAAKATLKGFAQKYDATMHVLGAGAAQAAAQQASRAVNAFPAGDHVANLITNYKTTGSPPGKFAGGVPAHAQGRQSMLDRAAESAMARSPRDPSRGLYVNRPTYVTGEESGQGEYVIAKNPRYRQSNTAYLNQAASDFGFALVPAFAGGKGKKNKKRGGGASVPASYDALTGPGSVYEALHNDMDYLEQVFQNDQQEYNITSSAGVLTRMIQDKRNQEGVYDQIAAEIVRIQGVAGRSPAMVPVPPLGKHPSGKKKKANKQAKAYNQAVKDYYDSKKNNQTELAQELRMIPLLKQALELDIMEMQNASSQGQILGESVSNTARQQLYQQFAGNIMPSTSPLGGSGVTGIGGGSAGSPGVARAGEMSGAATASARGAVGSSGNSTVNVTNNFASPPKDPHTWTKGVQFEIQAASA